MKDRRFANHDNETRDLILNFEQTLLKSDLQFYDLDELETIMTYYLDVNDLDAFKKAVDYAEQLYPDSIDVQIWRAHWYLANQNHAKALTLLNSLHQQEPDNTDVEFSLGEVYSEMGKHKEAISHYLVAATDGWQLARLYANVADEYYDLKDYDNAIHYYLRSLDEDPLMASALINYTDACCDASRLDEAITYISHLIDDHPYYKEAWHCLGCTYLNLGLNEKAIDAFEYAIAIDNGFMPSYMELVQMYETEGNVTQAASVLHRLLEHADYPAQVWLQLGRLYLRAENAPTALEYLQKALDLQPDDPDTLASVGLAELLSGDPRLALDHAHKALALAPDCADALFCAAMACNDKNMPQDAMAYFKRLVESPTCTEQHCRYYANYLFDNGHYDDLIDFAEESLEIYPHDAFYSSFLSAALFLTNRYRRLCLSLPDANKEILLELCPQMWQNPHVLPFLS